MELILYLEAFTYDFQSQSTEKHETLAKTNIIFSFKSLNIPSLSHGLRPIHKCPFVNANFVNPQFESHKLKRMPSIVSFFFFFGVAICVLLFPDHFAK